MMRYLPFLFSILYFVHGNSQDKKVLKPDDLRTWEQIRNDKISNNGKWISYEVVPYYGDKTLYVKNEDAQKSKEISRASRLSFSGNSDYAVFYIKAPFDSIRALQIKKVKKNKLPKDTLGIYVFENDSILKFSKFKSFKTAQKESSWMAIYLEKEKKKKGVKKKKRRWWIGKKKKSQAKKRNTKKYKTGDLLVINPVNGNKKRFKEVSEYSISKNGNTIAFVTYYGDSTQHSSVFSFNTKNSQLDTIFSGSGTAKKITLDEKGNSLAFVHSADTSKVKVYSLYHSKLHEKAKVIVDSTSSEIPEGWSVSEHSRIYFSKDGLHLWFGTAEKPKKAPKDTIPANEKVHLDIWSWMDKRLMPEQLKYKSRDEKKSFAAVYHINEQLVVQLADSMIDNVHPMKFGNSNYAVGYNAKPYQISFSWDFPWGQDVFLVDTKTGKKELVFKNRKYPFSIASNGKAAVYYNELDSNWYSIDLIKKDTHNLTSSLVEKGQKFYDSEMDVPILPYPLGLAGWTQNDQFIIINAKYEIWQIDPFGNHPPIAFSKGFADSTHNKLRYIRLDREEEYIRLDQSMVLKAQNIHTNESGYYVRYPNAERFQVLDGGNMRYSRLQKAKDTDRYIFRKEDAYHEPGIYYVLNSNRNLEGRFSNNKLVSSYNPQKEDYKWGNVQQYHWTDEDGKKRKGLLYLPEHINEEDSIPMLVYYYEKSFFTQHYHKSFRPSYSTISIPLYNSNGYAVFVPDITYGTGHPGKDANKAIVSGVKAILKSHPFIDGNRIGLQGQSWGGYQTAILITQTNMFKAAMAGAPVSNMTSAYGGIRWGSGLSRMFQYERTQSRIGKTLWNGTDLYLENSPLFHLPNVETPLLIMHNDKDGAVPWYQGIELFVGMRRLGKPCWMLNYNNEAHNLIKLTNRIDLSKRMFQFFNHYLKGEPMPQWMKNGIPAVRKGKENGFELIQENN